MVLKFVAPYLKILIKNVKELLGNVDFGVGNSLSYKKISIYAVTLDASSVKQT